ncbi:MAG: NUDIX domain-containing protein [Sporolactobacillus sp.]|nr:NUDIX domain-containing protein [Sporolactobacillus sp.]
MGYIEEVRSLVGHRPLILVGACALIENGQGDVLLQQRKDPYGYWGIPGGLMELDETIEETARREVREEAGLKIGPLHLLGIYTSSGPLSVAANGDRFRAVTVAYSTDGYSGSLVVDPQESLDFRFVPAGQLPERLLRHHRPILADFFRRKGK